MKKFGLFLIVLLQTVAISAQEDAYSLAPQQDKNILNHLDVGVNVGTTGIGIDVAVPIGNYVRIRTGYDYMPRFKFNSDFLVETTNGNIQGLIQKWDKYHNNIYEELEKRGIDINNYPKYKELIDQFGNIELHDQVTMGIRPNVHQFKFLVDVMPFKRNKHWSFTMGFFVGPSKMGDACNLEKEKQILEGMLAYNDLYIGVCKEEYPHIDALEEVLFKTGIAGFRLGNFENGNIALMVPAKDATARAEMQVNKVRPYFGFGYNTHLSKNRKWNFSVDAGVLLLGKPHIYVDNIYSIDKSVIDTENYIYDVVRWSNDIMDYQGPEELGIIHNHVDLVRDLHGIQGKVGDMVDIVSKFKVYPNISATFSYRLY